MNYYNNQYGDQYCNPMQDQWGNPMMGPAGPTFNGQSVEHSQFGYNSPAYSGGGYGYASQPTISSTSPGSGPYYPAQQTASPRTSFRLPFFLHT